MSSGFIGVDLSSVKENLKKYIKLVMIIFLYQRDKI